MVFIRPKIAENGFVKPKYEDKKYLKNFFLMSRKVY